VSGPTRKRGEFRIAAAGQPLQNAGLEKGADVLAEILRTADRNRPKVQLALSSGLLRSFRAALLFLKIDVFGVCLYCKATLGLSRVTAAPWTALCIQCQEAADRDDAEVVRIRSCKERK
jgi:RNA polymerase-binding transcription factor DksA